jgi:hypothetical protein
LRPKYGVGNLSYRKYQIEIITLTEYIILKMLYFSVVNGNKTGCTNIAPKIGSLKDAEETT